jgi:hypothetical protein
LIFFLVIRAVYLVSILIFIWRYYSSKDLLQSALITIFGLEVVGILLANFLFPPFFAAFSPILSCLVIAGLIIDPKGLTALQTASGMNIIIIISLVLASIILIKSEIRYE